MAEIATLEGVLAERFRELGLGATKLVWADFLGKLDKGTLSRILKGVMPLSEKRANDWATLLHQADPSQAPAFAARLLAAADQLNVPQTVDGFCNEVVRSGGAVDAERITDLFDALLEKEVLNPLVVIEYRDTPRAAPDAKYQSLGEDLAKAIARGLHVAMLMPFQTHGPAGGSTSRRGRQSHALKYMIDIEDECVRTYDRVRNLAVTHWTDSVASIDMRLRLYVPGADIGATFSPGFQAKIFYVQFDDSATLERHYRVFQWVSTPPRDLLIFRGNHIKPEPLRDSFFPIPHLFDLSSGEGKQSQLPKLPTREKGKKMLAEWRTALEQRWPRSGLPLDKSIWTSDYES